MKILSGKGVEMTDLEIIQALYNDTHLETKELQKVEQIIHVLRLNYTARYNQPQKLRNI